MLKEKTVFVLGAGASNDVGFPLGSDLLGRIRKRCLAAQKGTEKIDEYREAKCKLTDVIELGNQLALSPFQSIDDFLSHNTKFRDVARTLIAFELLPCETADTYNRQITEPCWMITLFRKMALQTELRDYKNNPVTFVTYNYDRSLEYCLKRDLEGRFGNNPKEIAEIMQEIPIIHLHGSFGNLDAMPYGDKSRQRNADMHIAGKSIIILDEAKADSNEFKQARQAILDAKRVGILGFGFHPQNMDRLDLKSVVGGKDVFMTHYDMSQTEFTSILKASNLGHNYSPKYYHEGKCLGLLKHTNLIL